MNNELSDFLKKLEELHSKKFKNDKDYLESCKASKDLNPKDYKIQPNHKLDEYFNKYGKKLEKGQLLAYKKDELWLMNKKATYWKIENESDFVYFEAQKNLKPLWISLIAVLAAGAIAGGVTAGVLLSKGNGSGEGEGGEGEVDPGSSITLKLNYDDISFTPFLLSGNTVHVMSLYNNDGTACYGTIDANNKLLSLDNVDSAQNFNFSLKITFWNGVTDAQLPSGVWLGITLSQFADKNGPINNMSDVSKFVQIQESGVTEFWVNDITFDLPNYDIQSYLEIGDLSIIESL